MPKRIEIEWETPIEIKSQSITGLVKMFQGDSIIDVEEVWRCIIEISPTMKGLRPAPGQNYLPQETADEKVSGLIYSLADAYLRGLNQNSYIYYWTEVD